MGLFDKRIKQEISQNTDTLKEEPLLRALLSGEVLTRDQIKGIPQVAADLDLIASTFASVPFRLYKRIVDEDGNDDTIEITDDPRVKCINMTTGDTLNGYQMKRAICEDYFLGKDGGGYIYIKRSGNHVTGLYYVKAEEIDIIENTDPIFKSYSILVRGKYYDPYDFLKLLRNTRNGMTGESMTRDLNMAFQAAFSILKFQVTTLKKGGNKKGFLEAERKLGDPEIKMLKESWKNLYSENSDNVSVLNNGVKFKESSNNATEMQLNQSKVTLDKEIDGLFHISSNNEEFIKRAVLPIGNAFETTLNADFLTEAEKQLGYFWQADYSELLKASMKERFEAYKVAKETGWMMINEIREMENMEKIEGMNVLNVGLSAALYNTDTGEYYVPNTDTAKNRADKQEADGKGEGDNE